MQLLSRKSKYDKEINVDYKKARKNEPGSEKIAVGIYLGLLGICLTIEIIYFYSDVFDKCSFSDHSFPLDKLWLIIWVPISMNVLKNTLINGTYFEIILYSRVIIEPA